MSTITDFIGRFFTKTSNPDTTMGEMGRSAGDGQVYFDNSSNQTGVTQGGSLMVYNATNGAWYGVNLTTSTSTTTTTTTSTTTTTTTSTSTS
jgi:uncharacterized protein involved in high-affinity Fe2+ transport